MAIGIVLSIIPIVNFLVFGYFVNIAGATLKKNYGMPKWDDWGNLFVKGLILVAMMIVYTIPAIIVVVIGAGSLAVGGIAGMMTDPSALIGGLAGAGIFFLIGALLALVAMILLPAAVIGYAKTGNVNAFFDFKTIFKKAFRGSYIITWVVMMVLSIIVGVILGIIPLIGPAIGGFIMGTASYTALTEAYME
ncbi:MAG: DUF4013 domain-containing protein [Candidatus Diapherotrites archaeon]|nr:DUF4013 domain-containing protein [Candidatus Diapherotrites archaeon]